MRDRAAVVIIENGKVALIQRIKDDSIYYVFPGGGIEVGETPEEAARREAVEELGVQVKINKCIAKVQYNGTQYYYLAEIVSGTFGSGQGEEFLDREADGDSYLPMWVEITELSLLDVIPEEVGLKVETLIK